MAELINLRAARKRAQRQQDEQRAAANRRLHGQSKHIRKLESERRAKVRRDLDGHRIDTGDRQ
jgi:hypothetical protein